MAVTLTLPADMPPVVAKVSPTKVSDMVIKSPAEPTHFTVPSVWTCMSIKPPEAPRNSIVGGLALFLFGKIRMSFAISVNYSRSGLMICSTWSGVMCFEHSNCLSVFSHLGHQFQFPASSRNSLKHPWQTFSFKIR
jgi:hypothetical protein